MAQIWSAVQSFVAKVLKSKKKIDHVKEYISIFATIFSDLVIFLSIYKFLSIIVKMLRKENYRSSLEETIHEKHFTQIISIFSIRRRMS